jgi:hypothetical protein
VTLSERTIAQSAGTPAAGLSMRRAPLVMAQILAHLPRAARRPLIHVNLRQRDACHFAAPRFAMARRRSACAA